MADDSRFELLFGKRPFRGRTNTGLTQAILHDTLTWPDDAPVKCSTEGMQAIRAVSSIKRLMLTIRSFSSEIRTSD